MSAGSSFQPQVQQQDADALVRAGGWLFTRRTWVPLPIVLALLLVIPKRAPSASVLWSGATVVALGELVRLWAVRHIGVISRTRSARLGPLIVTGPFALLRNPLYLGNIALWVGFAVSANLPLLVPPIVFLLSFEYHAIVRWEEQLLEGRFGDVYRKYAARVPRWIPSLRRTGATPESRLTFSWRDALFSERGTLIAIVVGYLLLWLKSRA